MIPCRFTPNALLGMMLLVLALGDGSQLLISQTFATRFMYEGRLVSEGNPAEGVFDLRSSLFDAESSGNQIGSSVVLPGVNVTNGYFVAVLDFGISTTRPAGMWLEIAVRTNGGGDFAVVPPRQSMAAIPFAVHSTYAANLVGAAFNITLWGSTTNANSIADRVAVYDQNQVLTSGAITRQELGFLSGVGAPVQAQLNTKMDTVNGAVTNLSVIGALQVSSGQSTSVVTAADVSFLSGLGVINVKGAPYWAVGDGVANDSDAIQAALDAVARGNGGVVYLPGGVYKISRVLVVGSRTRVLGAGRGISIIRGTAGALIGRVFNGAPVYCNIAMVAADESSIENLTVDNRTNGNLSNGIAMIPDGVDYAGTVCTRCFVQNCEVLGFGSHQYLIWNYKGRTIRIINNYLDGGVSDNSGTIGLEGVESFGGDDVVIRDNTVLNVGLNGINLASVGNHTMTSLINVTVANNVVRGCYNGIWCNSSSGTASTNNVIGVQILQNRIESCFNSGFYFSGVSGTLMEGVLLHGNVFQRVRYGVYLNNPDGASIRSLSLAGNVVLNPSTSNNTVGIVLSGMSNTSITDNTLSRLAYGIIVVNSTNIVIRDNRLEGLAGSGARVWQSAKVFITGNRVTDFNLQRSGSFAGVDGTGLSRAMITGNSFSSDYDIIALRVDATSSFVVAKDNLLLYPSTLSSPIVNSSSNGNVGLVRFSAGASSLEVPNGLVTGSTRLSIVQEAGTPVAFRTQKTSTGFRLILGGPAVGNETFRFEVLL